MPTKSNNDNDNSTSLLLIWHNQLGKPSSLIAVADNYHIADNLILSHINENYSAHTPRLILIGGIHKVGIENISDRVLKDVHYSIEFATLNTRRV